MRTRCPECGSSLEVTQPGTDPTTGSDCSACGAFVLPGAFLCPHCSTGLQVNRDLLPRDGARGRCPSCSGVVLVPDLSSTTAAPPEPDENATMRLGAAEIMAAAQEEATPAEEAMPGQIEPDPGSTTRLDEASLADAMSEGATQRLSADDFAAALAATQEEEPVALATEDEAASPDDAGATRRLDAGELAASLPPDDAGATRRLDAGELAASLPPGDAGATGQLDPSQLALGRPPDEGGATRRIDVAALQAQPRSAASEPIPAPELNPPAPRPSPRPRTSSGVKTAPAPEPRRGKLVPVLLGILLGAGMFGGGAYGVATLELWSFPPFPFPEVGLPETAAWTALLGVAGALIGAIAAFVAGRR